MSQLSDAVLGITEGLTSYAVIIAAAEVLRAGLDTSEAGDKGVKDDIQEARIRIQAYIHTAPKHAGDTAGFQLCIALIAFLYDEMKNMKSH